VRFFQPYRPWAVLLLWVGILVSKTNAATPPSAPASTATSSTALPPLDAVLQRVMQTSAVENAEYHQFNQHYFYTREKVTEFFDNAGNLKSRQDRQSTNDPTPVSVPLTIPVPDPAPGPTVRPVDSVKQGQKADPPNIHGVALGKKEDLMSPDIIKRFKLTMVGRDTINGRPALVIDFEPVSDSLPVLNIKDRFINSVEGRAWIDENDFTLEKVYLHLKQKVSVLGGIAGSVSKFSFSFDRERTPDGFWFTRDLDWHVEAREATLHRVVDHHEEILGVQKVR
jgi:hypothetical protein